MFDIVISGGELVDGTGAPRRRADVGIRNGRIVAVGDLDGPAFRTIDAAGRIVSPGFIDMHTHYDVQAFWDPYFTPSCLHGVTTILGGNCGFTVAPLNAESADYLRTMLARVEGMPIEALEAGAPWDWTSTEEYYARLEGSLGLNAGFLVGHSTVRRLVMGDAATERVATAAELQSMDRLLRSSLDAGGLGFSSSWSFAHYDGTGSPVPSRWADADEIVALAQACRDYEGTSVEFNPNIRGDDYTANVELMARMSVAAERPLNWNLLVISGAQDADQAARLLAASDMAAQFGGRVVALALPDRMVLRLTFRRGDGIIALAGWSEAMALPPDEKLTLLRDRDGRRRLEAAAQEPSPARFLADWGNHVIVETFVPGLDRYVGRQVADIAKAEGKSPFDALVDIACADDLQTVFVPGAHEDTDADRQARLAVWRDPRAVLGGSDAGAHLDRSSQFNYHTQFLATSVREQELMSLEEAIHRFTQVPAQLYGLRDRGVIAAGAFADLVIFDDASVASGPVHTRFDLPGGAARLFAEAEGIDRVLVNGVEVVAGGALTDARPGSLLRAGRSTVTAPLVAT